MQRIVFSIAPAALAVGGAFGPAGAGIAAATGSDGASLFAQHCLACHGPDGRGVEAQGVTLVGSGFVQTASIDELTALLRAGRMPNDPVSISGRAMPGFAWIAEDDLRAIAEHVRTMAD